jgi:hypothetical protein
MLVGIWPQGAPAVRDERMRAAIGADHYVTSLQEAVEICTSMIKRVRPATAALPARIEAEPEIQKRPPPEPLPMLGPQEQPQPQLP